MCGDDDDDKDDDDDEHKYVFVCIDDDEDGDDDNKHKDSKVKKVKKVRTRRSGANVTSQRCVMGSLGFPHPFSSVASRQRQEDFQLHRRDT